MFLANLLQWRSDAHTAVCGDVRSYYKASARLLKLPVPSTGNFKKVRYQQSVSWYSQTLPRPNNAHVFSRGPSITEVTRFPPPPPCSPLHRHKTVKVCICTAQAFFVASLISYCFYHIAQMTSILRKSRERLVTNTNEFHHEGDLHSSLVSMMNDMVLA